MKLGISRKDITPDSPVPMAGYYENRMSQGSNDRLYVRALYFCSDKQEPVVFLQYDLLCIDKICLDKIYTGLKNSKNGSISKDRIVTFCTHTHSAFGGILNMKEKINQELQPLFGKSSPHLVDLVVKQSIDAVFEAAENCAETTLRISRSTVNGVGTNRRNKDIPCDNSLFIMEFMREDNKKILLYNYSCHPTVLNKTNFLLSADFPGAVASKLEGSIYDMVVFINGSAGDISTRFTRKQSSFSECDRYAEIISDAINNSIKSDFIPLENIDLKYHPISLNLAEFLEPQHARDHLQDSIHDLIDLKKKGADSSTLRKAASNIEGALMSLIKISSLESKENEIHRTVYTAILTINSIKIVCSPFEVFSSLALILKKNKNAECFGYLNELEGYLADCDAWDNLDYEALSGDFSRGEGERYIEMVTALI